MPSSGDTLSLGKLGKAVGANGDTTSETSLAGDGRGSNAETSLSDFYISATTAPDPIGSLTAFGATTTVTAKFSNPGSLFQSRIANQNGNFTWAETDGAAYITLTTTSDYTAPFVLDTGKGISFTIGVTFADSFNDHATNYNTQLTTDGSTPGT